MKTKVLRLLLLATVIAVWGMIFMKLNGSTESVEPIKQIAIPHKAEVEQEQIKLPQTFVLARDPFFNSKNQVKKAHQQVKPTTARKQVQKQVPVSQEFVWPQVSFKGFVTPNQNQNATVAIMTINGDDVIVNKGTMVNELKVASVSSSEVILQYGTELRSFPTVLE